MKYSFEPLWTRFEKNNKPKLDINFNVSTSNICNRSFGLFIFIQLTVYFKISICLKPIGEIKFKS